MRKKPFPECKAGDVICLNSATSPSVLLVEITKHSHADRFVGLRLDNGAECNVEFGLEVVDRGTRFYEFRFDKVEIVSLLDAGKCIEQRQAEIDEEARQKTNFAKNYGKRTSSLLARCKESTPA